MKLLNYKEKLVGDEEGEDSFDFFENDFSDQKYEIQIPNFKIKT